MRSYVFNPAFSVIAERPGVAAIGELEREQGVYSATPDFVRAYCGPIAKALLELVPDSYYARARELGLSPNIDVRIHRLYPGDFPAYPGWHCDGEYRETYFSQPDLERIKVSEHLCCTVSSAPNGVSNCQFLTDPFACDVGEVSQEHTLWGQVDAAIRAGHERATWGSKDGQMVAFDSWSLHRAMPAKIRGWRLFFRMSMWHRPNLGGGGMLTRQEQVYKLAEGSGW
jgi:hypothetical protein